MMHQSEQAQTQLLLPCNTMERSITFLLKLVENLFFGKFALDNTILYQKQESAMQF
jgi:hypothetical protein